MKTDWRWVGAFVGVGIALAGYWRWRAAPEPVPEAREAAGPVAHSLPAHSAADSAPTSSRRIAASAPAEPSPIEAETEPAAAKAVVSGRVLSDGGT